MAVRDTARLAPGHEARAGLKAGAERRRASHGQIAAECDGGLPQPAVNRQGVQLALVFAPASMSAGPARLASGSGTPLRVVSLR